MEKAVETPLVVSRACGGWLARSAAAEPIKIAVAEATEQGVVEAYCLAIQAWRRNLAQVRPVEGSGSV